jgi:hypothetical protein
LTKYLIPENANAISSHRTTFSVEKLYSKICGFSKAVGKCPLMK